MFETRSKQWIYDLRNWVSEKRGARRPSVGKTKSVRCNLSSPDRNIGRRSRGQPGRAGPGRSGAERHGSPGNIRDTGHLRKTYK